jgi:hypothetical protein
MAKLRWEKFASVWMPAIPSGLKEEDFGNETFYLDHGVMYITIEVKHPTDGRRWMATLPLEENEWIWDYEFVSGDSPKMKEMTSTLHKQLMAAVEEAVKKGHVGVVGLEDGLKEEGDSSFPGVVQPKKGEC